jgi:hypothetical protein
LRLKLLSLGNIAGRSVDELLLGIRAGTPQQPFVGAILAAIAILEGDDLVAVGELMGPSVFSQAGFKCLKKPSKPAMQSMSRERVKNRSRSASTRL